MFGWGLTWGDAIDFENTGQNKILERTVSVAESPQVWAEAVKPERMRRNPSPLWLRS